MQIADVSSTEGNSWQQSYRKDDPAASAILEHSASASRCTRVVRSLPRALRMHSDQSIAGTLRLTTAGLRVRPSLGMVQERIACLVHKRASEREAQQHKICKVKWETGAVAKGEITAEWTVSQVRHIAGRFALPPLTSLRTGPSIPFVPSCAAPQVIASTGLKRSHCDATLMHLSLRCCAIAQF